MGEIPGSKTLRDAWDENAADWVRWARSPELDHAFWRLNLPALIALLPSPDGLTLDVGCGEGRVARAMKELGHRVVGVESSPALVTAARQADPYFEVHVADAAQLPFPDDTFDLVVASLALMNMDEMPAVVSEIARVLCPAGRFCFSVLHPINSWGDAGEVGYFQTVRYTEEMERDGARMTLHDTHRPLSDYFNALQSAGFLVERVVEPLPDDAYLAAVPEVERWRERPGFLHVLAVLSR
ncbi:MAG TPA: class I SAM-dependent methyltransferase [Solirubrobacteraceae bacterium]|jgi:SAM-dependent methyltransferase|nr:class I SAM-dependent methyltransferase [Solirubrobacteraceae bacterium]